MARDYRAEYQARKARAQARGYSGYGQSRPDRSKGRSADEMRAKAAAARQAASDRLKQIHDTPAGRLVTTTSKGKGWGVVAGQLRSHGTDPVRVTVRMQDGSRRTLFGRGQNARRALDQLGGSLDGVAAALNNAGTYGAEPVDADAIADVSVELLSGWPGR